MFGIAVQLRASGESGYVGDHLVPCSTVCMYIRYSTCVSIHISSYLLDVCNAEKLGMYRIQYVHTVCNKNKVGRCETNYCLSVLCLVYLISVERDVDRSTENLFSSVVFSGRGVALEEGRGERKLSSI